jgi:hypothetical protein
MKRNAFQLRGSALGILLVVFAAAAASVNAQTTAFTYQGRLTDNNGAANGTYNLEFRLFDADAAGNQIGAAQSSLVTIANGIFTVKLDFGAAAFGSGAARWLEIQVGATTLTPRQEITSTPAAIRSLSSGSADGLSASCVSCVTSAQIQSLAATKITGTIALATNANQLGGVAANQFVLTNDARLTNVRALNNLTGNVTLTAGSNLTLTASGNNLILNTATPLLKKHTASFDLTAAANVTFSHALGTEFVQVSVYKVLANGDWELVPVGPVLLATQIFDANTVRVAILQPGSYHVVVIG